MRRVRTFLPPLKTDEQDVNDNEGDNNDVGVVDVPEGDTCCYPGSLFFMIPGGGPPLDECQGSWVLWKSKEISSVM